MRRPVAGIPEFRVPSGRTAGGRGRLGRSTTLYSNGSLIVSVLRELGGPFVRPRRFRSVPAGAGRPAGRGAARACPPFVFAGARAVPPAVPRPPRRAGRRTGRRAGRRRPLGSVRGRRGRPPAVPADRRHRWCGRPHRGAPPAAVPLTGRRRPVGPPRWSPCPRARRCDALRRRRRTVPRPRPVPVPVRPLDAPSGAGEGTARRAPGGARCGSGETCAALLHARSEPPFRRRQRARGGPGAHPVGGGARRSARPRRAAPRAVLRPVGGWWDTPAHVPVHASWNAASLPPARDRGSGPPLCM